MTIDGTNQAAQTLAPWTPRQRLVAWLILLFAAAFRIGRFLDNRALWSDEASLADNLITRTFAELLQPLSHDQSAPFGFLLLARSLVNLFGTGELALRLVPLAAGLISLVLFLQVARRWLIAPAALSALLLFAISETLIYYSTEVKQYSVEVAASLAILAVCQRINWRAPQWPSCLLATIVCSLSQWFSHAAVFVVAGVLASVLAASWRSRRPLLHPLTISILCGINFIICYRLSLASLTQSSYLVDFWTQVGGFMPLPPRSMSDLNWFLRTPVSYFNDPAGLPSTEPLALMLAVVGGIHFYRKDRERLGWLVLPFVLVLLASGLRKFPFATSMRDYVPIAGRLILFTVPLALLLVGAGIEYIWNLTRTQSRSIVVVCVILLAMIPGVFALKRLVSPPQQMNLREELDWVQKSWRESDSIYFHWSAEPSHRYYRHTHPFPAQSILFGINSRDDWMGYETDLHRLAGKERVWMVFLNHPEFNSVNEKRTFTYLLAKMNVSVQEREFAGGEVWLVTAKSVSAPGAPGTPSADVK